MSTHTHTEHTHKENTHTHTHTDWRQAKGALFKQKAAAFVTCCPPPSTILHSPYPKPQHPATPTAKARVKESEKEGRETEAHILEMGTEIFSSTRKNPKDIFRFSDLKS